jgi:5-methylcytosine-specific restriction endonuclease McrA
VYFEPDEKSIKREREKAQALRKSNWWLHKLNLGVCYYCQQKVDGKLLTMDHVVPLSRGGQSSRSNIVAACKPCNIKKKDLIPMEWEAFIGGQIDRGMHQGPVSTV